MDQNKILLSHITLGSSSGDLYNKYLDYIRSKYGDSFVDNGIPFVTPYEDTFQGWQEGIKVLPQEINTIEDIEYEEIKPKLLGDDRR